MIKNNFYALKLLQGVSKKRVFHIALHEFADYFERIFYQIFFLRYVVKSVENGESFEKILNLILICCVVFLILGAYSSYLKSYVDTITDVKVHRGIYHKLFQKARNVEYECFEDSDFYSRYTMAIDKAPERIVNSVDSLFNIIFGSIASIIALYTIFSIDHYAVIFIVFPLLGNFVFGKKVNQIYNARNQDNVKNIKRVSYIDRIMCLSDYAEEIRYSNIHSLMLSKFDKSVNDTVSIMDRYGNCATKYMGIKNVLSFPMIFEGVMLYSVFRTMVTKSMGLAELAIMFSIMSDTSWILIGLFNAISDSLNNGLYIQYIREFLERKEKIPEDQDGIYPDEHIDSIVFNHVTFYYNKETPLIEDMSFTIKKNQTIAMVGCNGAGKSTIIKLLLRLYDPVEGEILVNGINIKEYNLQAYRKLFSVAFQDYKIMAMSFKDNIIMGREIPDAENTVIKVLKKVGLYQKIKKMPDKTDTVLTKEFDSNGVVLSGGEAQKLAVARAFAQNSKIKIFDEPSSALDPIAEYDLYQQIMEAGQENIMIYVSHRLSSVKNSDYVYMIEHGRIIEEGTHSELMKLHKAYYKMYKKQAMSYLAID